MENFILVQLEQPRNIVEGNKIIRLVRTYLSESRAIEDIELLEAADKTAFFKIEKVEHIDS